MLTPMQIYNSSIMGMLTVPTIEDINHYFHRMTDIMLSMNLSIVNQHSVKALINNHTKSFETFLSDALTKENDNFETLVRDLYSAITKNQTHLPIDNYIFPVEGRHIETVYTSVFTRSRFSHLPHRSNFRADPKALLVPILTFTALMHDNRFSDEDRCVFNYMEKLLADPLLNTNDTLVFAPFTFPSMSYPRSDNATPKIGYPYMVAFEEAEYEYYRLLKVQVEQDPPNTITLDTSYLATRITACFNSMLDDYNSHLFIENSD